jgi:hypothetical protein
MTDPRTPVDDLNRIAYELQQLSARIERLESPSGTSVYQTVSKLSALVNDIQAQLDAYNANRYTNAQIDSRILNPGQLGNVASSGSIAGTYGTFAQGLSSVGAYSTLVTGGGQYRATWQHESGFYGYAPSSRRFKTDIENYTVPLDDVDDLVVRRFHYLATPPYDQAAQPWSIGFIAEEVAAINDGSLSWLIDYDSDGQPFGIKYELFAVALVQALQAANARRAKQLYQEKMIPVQVTSLLGNTQDVDVVWDTPFADTAYTIFATALPPSGLLTNVAAAPIMSSRTKTGAKVRLSTTGITSGTVALTVIGVHV